MTLERFLTGLCTSILLFGSCQNPIIEEPNNHQEAIVFPSSVERAPTIPDTGGKLQIEFTASDSWTAGFINTRADDWINVTPTQGGSGKATITISAKQNDTYEDRNATLQIKSGTAAESFVISQKQKDNITITKSKIEIGREGGSVDIEVKANIDYTYVIDDECSSWVSFVETKAYESKTLSFMVASNESVEKREGSIVFYSGDLKETVNIYQEGSSPEIIISQNKYSVSAEREIIQIEIKSNVDVIYSLPAGCDWIQAVETKSMSTNTFSFLILENELYDDRTAEIVFSDNKASVSEKVTITQFQKNAIIIGDNILTVPSTENIIAVKINANIAFSVLVEESAKEWISEINTKGLVEYEKHFLLKSNTTGNERRGVISFFNDETGQKAELTIIQSGIDTGDYKDISFGETANCYILTSPGKYCFRATVAGNGEKGLLEEYGFPASVTLSPESTELIWSDFNLEIENVALSGDYVYFDYISGKGNALIAVKNNERIIWSWHLWATDQPEDIILDGFTFMDRNLGAISAEHNNTEKENGLYYQWGRKDPFLGEGLNVSYEEVSREDIVSKGIENPDSFYFLSDRCDITSFSSLWGNPDGILGGQGQKTIYDPCPPGYTLPDESFPNCYGQPWKSDGVYQPFEDYTQDSSGILLRNKLWLPLSGIWDGYYLPAVLVFDRVYAHYLTNLLNGPNYVILLQNKERGLHLTSTINTAGSVRCVLEDHAPANIPSVQSVTVENVRNTSLSFTGRITYNGNSKVLSYGVRWGETRSMENVCSIDGFPSGVFSIELESLPEDKTLFLQAFATNSVGTGYGEVLTVKTLSRKELAQHDLKDIYQMMYRSGWTTTGNYHQYFGILSSTLTSELMGDDFIMSAIGNGWFWYDFIYDVKTRYDEKTGRSQDLWVQYYTYIEKANRIIDYMTEKEELRTSSILGQAYAIRAYSYFMLAQWFSRTYVGHELDKCVPILSTYEESLHPNKPRASVKEVFDFIISDIDKACEFLDTEAKHSDIKEIDKYVANGIRAKIYLELADYTRAYESAKIAVQGASIDFDASFKYNDVFQPCVLWGAEVIPYFESSNYNPWFMVHMDYSYGSYGNSSRKCVSPWLIKKMNPSDKRYLNWWKYEVLSNGSRGYQQYKFLFRDPKSSLGGDLVFMRAAEMQLIMAEAACRLGNETEAKTLLNELMKTRLDQYDCSNLTGLSMGALTTDETGSLLEEIILQRRIELWGEAGRIFDIKRLKQGFDRSLIDGWPSSAILANKNTRDPESFDWVMTIPQSAFDANSALDPNVDQNPI